MDPAPQPIRAFVLLHEVCETPLYLVLYLQRYALLKHALDGKTCILSVHVAFGIGIRIIRPHPKQSGVEDARCLVILLGALGPLGAESVPEIVREVGALFYFFEQQETVTLRGNGKTNLENRAGT